MDGNLQVHSLAEQVSQQVWDRFGTRVFLGIRSFGLKVTPEDVFGNALCTIAGVGRLSDEEAKQQIGRALDIIIHSPPLIVYGELCHIVTEIKIKALEIYCNLRFGRTAFRDISKEVGYSASPEIG